MPTIKDLDSLKTDLKALEGRLQSVESQDLDSHLKELQKAHSELAGRLNELVGAAKVVGLPFTVMAILFAVLSAMSLLNIYRYNRFEAVRTEAYEVLVTQFEEKIADTVDRISFLDPNDEQVYKIAEMKKMQDRLHALDKSLDAPSLRFQVRSDLADTIMPVIDNRTDEALSRLRTVALRTTNTDPFVEARALTLEAIVLVRAHRDCSNPEVEPKVRAALKKDSGVGAAYNILGVCLTEKANRASQSEQGGKTSTKVLQNGISYYELAYTLKPTDLTKARSLNNKVSANLTFFEIALRLGNLDQVLTSTPFHDFETFINDSRREVELSQQLLPDQAAYLETEAELHGLRNAYYAKRNQAGDALKAEDAFREEREQFKKAISSGLYRKSRSFKDAMDDLKSDPLLGKLYDDQEIKKLIRNAVLPD